MLSLVLLPLLPPHHPSVTMPLPHSVPVAYHGCCASASPLVPGKVLSLYSGHPVLCYQHCFPHHPTILMVALSQGCSPSNTSLGASTVQSCYSSCCHQFTGVVVATAHYQQRYISNRCNNACRYACRGVSASMDGPLPPNVALRSTLLPCRDNCGAQDDPSLADRQGKYQHHPDQGDNVTEDSPDPPSSPCPHS